MSTKEWTPARGMIRGAIAGGIVWLPITAALIPLAAHMPYMVMGWILRAPLAFLLLWVYAAAVTRFAGMGGDRCGLIAAGLMLLTLISHHVVWANIGGVQVIVTEFEYFVFPAGFLPTLANDPVAAKSAELWIHPMSILLCTIAPAGAVYFFFRSWSDMI